MPAEIGPLRDDEVEALSAFLTRGFGAPGDAVFAAPDVLRWKYLRPLGEPGEPLPRSLVARDANGRIVGHVGFSITRLCVAKTPERPMQSYTAVHMMDWLGSSEHKGVGGRLMRRIHGLADLPYGFGGSLAARTVCKAAGYAHRATVPVYQRVLRPGYSLRDPAQGPIWRRVARAARDGLRRFRDQLNWREVAGTMQLKPIAAFGDEIERLYTAAEGPLVLSAPTPATLNAMLAFPRGGLAGWHIYHDDLLVGYAVTTVQPRDRVHVGKIANLVLATRDVHAWRVAFELSCIALQSVFADADFVQACGPTPWEANGLRAAGFREGFRLDLPIRDRNGLLPADAPLHASFLEADYAYLP